MPVRKPGYVSPPDPREVARKQFLQQLIAALEDGKAGQAMRDATPKDAPRLERSARMANDAMQFDFPVRVSPTPSNPAGQAPCCTDTRSPARSRVFRHASGPQSFARPNVVCAKT